MMMSWETVGVSSLISRHIWFSRTFNLIQTRVSHLFMHTHIYTFNMVGVYDEGSDVHTPGHAQGQISGENSSKHSSPLSPQGLYSGMYKPSSDLIDCCEVDETERFNDRNEQEGSSDELQEIVGYGEIVEDVDNYDCIEVETAPYIGAIFL